MLSPEITIFTSKMFSHVHINRIPVLIPAVHVPVWCKFHCVQGYIKVDKCLTNLSNYNFEMCQPIWSISDCWRHLPAAAWRIAVMLSCTSRLESCANNLPAFMQARSPKANIAITDWMFNTVAMRVIYRPDVSSLCHHTFYMYAIFKSRRSSE